MKLIVPVALIGGGAYLLTRPNKSTFIWVAGGGLLVAGLYHLTK